MGWEMEQRRRMRRKERRIKFRCQIQEVRLFDI